MHTCTALVRVTGQKSWAFLLHLKTPTRIFNSTASSLSNEARGVHIHSRWIIQQSAPLEKDTVAALQCVPRAPVMRLVYSLRGGREHCGRRQCAGCALLRVTWSRIVFASILIWFYHSLMANTANNISSCWFTPQNRYVQRLQRLTNLYFKIKSVTLLC